jgi:hypothetical protein
VNTQINNCSDLVQTTVFFQQHFFFNFHNEIWKKLEKPKAGPGKGAWQPFQERAYLSHNKGPVSAWGHTRLRMQQLEGLGDVWGKCGIPPDASALARHRDATTVFHPHSWGSLTGYDLPANCKGGPSSTLGASPTPLHQLLLESLFGCLFILFCLFFKINIINTGPRYCTGHRPRLLSWRAPLLSRLSSLATTAKL